MKRMLTATLTLALTLGCPAAALAEGAGGDAPGGSPAEASSPMSGGLQTLVDKGVISQETLDAILAYMESNRPDLPDGSSPSDAPDAPDGQQAGMAVPQEALDQLLADGTLTQDEYDAIVAYQNENPQSTGSQPSGSQPSGSPSQGKGPGGNPPSGGHGGPGSHGGPGGPGGGSAKSVTYAAATEFTSATEQSEGVYSSETPDENAIIADSGASVTLDQPTVTKTGDSESGDNCSFYGQNAGVLAKGGASLTITGGTVTTDAVGANGVFSYGGNGGQNGAAGDGTTVTVSDTTITTTGNLSGGIMTSGGGVTYASNLTIETSGMSSASIRSDRGGGTVVVDGGSYTTNGLGSPTVYSTADISVSNATLTSNLSEGVCIEGKNSVTLTDCDLTVSNTQRHKSARFLDSIMIYQSMSGDSNVGTSSFTMNGGTLTSKSGHVFHVTNTHTVVTLNGVKIVNEAEGNVLLSVCDDGWSGAANQAEVYANAQELNGAVLVGDNSTLNLTLSEGSTFTGSVSGDITNFAGDVVSTETGEVSVTLDATSTWTLTADSYVTSFNGDPSQVVSNGHTLYVNGEALEGVA